MARPLTKLKPKRRWLRFSLRTAFIIVSLLCVALRLWVVPAERQRRAVAAIEALGGVIHYAEPSETDSEGFPIKIIRRWLPRDYIDKVDRIYLSSTQVTDAELINLQGLRDLQHIDLTGTRLTDAGLVHLNGLTGLRELWIGYTQVTDVGLVRLKDFTGLQKLYLFNTHITDAGLVHLQELKCLERLSLEHTKVTRAAAAKLRKLLPNCKVFGR